MTFAKHSVDLCLLVTVLFGVNLLATMTMAQGPGGPMSNDQKLVKKFDSDGDGLLNQAERKEARAFIENQSRGQQRRGPRGRGNREPGKPGPKVEPADVKNYPHADLYDQAVLRTFFLEFESDDWEKELEVFKPTDVEVPGKLTVDGNQYDNIGVSFRGASSFFMIPAGLKRSLNLSIDFVESDQRLYGYKSLNLLNCNGDASMMSSALYSYICGQLIPTPKVNYVKVVINGESWGLYVSSQQFNRVFVSEHFDSEEGRRWKVSGSPRGDGGLRYLGDDVEEYRKRFEIKSKDTPESWEDLINLCRVLNETPTDKLEETLDPILDVDGALWFLAVDNALSNSDGYWTRASDYNIYQEPGGKFHILPHDMNEAFKMGRGRRGGPRGGPRQGRRGGTQGRGGPPPPRPTQDGRQGRGGPPQGRGGDANPGRRPPGGPGGFGGGGGPKLDPLIGLDEERKPLRSKLLSVPKLQQRYLEHVRTVAEMLQWDNIGPRVESTKRLIEDDVAADTRKLFTIENFRSATSDQVPDESSTHLRAFCEQRSKYLLNYEKIKALADKAQK